MSKFDKELHLSEICGEISGLSDAELMERISALTGWPVEEPTADNELRRVLRWIREARRNKLTEKQ